MPAAYDSYDYPSYWKDRNYEHKSELMAFQSLVNRIKNIKTAVDLGAGFGRLTPLYLIRAKKIILVDPSAKLLKLARFKIKSKKVIFLQSSLENLNGKLPKKSADLVILVRVLHHIKNLDLALSIIRKLLKKGGYFILEFPNKRHLKATVTQFLKGNFTFALDIFPKDLSTKKSIDNGFLPFTNFHPDYVTEKLKNYGFKIIETRSVSNIRNGFIKKHIPLEVLLLIEKYLQVILSKFYFGPSIFILSKKLH